MGCVCVSYICGSKTLSDCEFDWAAKNTRQTHDQAHKKYKTLHHKKQYPTWEEKYKNTHFHR